MSIPILVSWLHMSWYLSEFTVAEIECLVRSQKHKWKCIVSSSSLLKKLFSVYKNDFKKIKLLHGSSV